MTENASGTATSQRDDSRPVEVLVGRIGRAHGVRGDVTIDVRTDEPERRFADGMTFDTPVGKLELQESRWHGQRLLATFVGVRDRNAAEALRGTELHVVIPVDERPDDPEEFYDHQLIGLSAVTDAGELVGEVGEVLHLPAQDLLVVRRNGAEVLIPFVTEIVPTVDIDAGRLVVVPPSGLLDEG
ncbi:MAG: ribosome maturation factor RimM [Nocardioidaceae bacterium]|nr:ribosome maturation factor RimM [Nocardioidaceae bacterium]